MGADGHIGIYDHAKLEKKYGKEYTKQFLENFLSSKMYRQTMGGKEYITRYWGDNMMDCSDLYDTVSNCYCQDTDTFNTKSWSYEKWYGNHFMALTKEQRDLFIAMIGYLENDCRITEWEVWT